MKFLNWLKALPVRAYDWCARRDGGQPYVLLASAALCAGGMMYGIFYPDILYLTRVVVASLSALGFLYVFYFIEEVCD